MAKGRRADKSCTDHAAHACGGTILLYGRNHGMTQFPPQTNPGGHHGGHMKPHRGVLVLVFGILSFFICVLFGVAAWIMGNGDLREMDAGLMDPSGRGLTQAGKILGMVSCLLNIVAVVLGIILAALGIIGAAASAGGGGP